MLSTNEKEILEEFLKLSELNKLMKAKKEKVQEVLKATLGDKDQFHRIGDLNVEVYNMRKRKRLGVKDLEEHLALQNRMQEARERKLFVSTSSPKLTAKTSGPLKEHLSSIKDKVLADALAPGRSFEDAVEDYYRAKIAFKDNEELLDVMKESVRTVLAKQGQMVRHFGGTFELGSTSRTTIDKIVLQQMFPDGLPEQFREYSDSVVLFVETDDERHLRKAMMGKQFELDEWTRTFRELPQDWVERDLF